MCLVAGGRLMRNAVLILICATIVSISTGSNLRARKHFIWALLDAFGVSKEDSTSKTNIDGKSPLGPIVLLIAFTAMRCFEVSYNEEFVFIMTLKTRVN